MNVRPAAFLRLAGIAALASAAHAQSISTYAGGGAAVNYSALKYSVVPTTLAVASNGMVYFGNFAGQESAAYQLNPGTDTLTLVAGNNTSGYSGDGGPATGAQISTICGIALDSAGDLYIADCDSEVVRRVDASTGVITTVAGTGSGGNLGGDGGPATSATLNSPHGLALDAAGNLYIADTANNAIRRVDASSGVITTVAGSGTAGYSGNTGLATRAKLNGPMGVVLDAAGNLYIADTQNNVVRLVAAATEIITTFAGNTLTGYSGNGGPAKGARLNLPQGVALDSAGDLYIADTFNSVIRLVNASTGIISAAAGDGTAGYSGDGGPATKAALDHPAAVAIDGSGNLYIPDQNNFNIRVVNSSGTISTIAGDTFSSYGGDGGSATGAQLYEPMGAVAVDSSGNLIIPDSSNQVVRRVSAGTITTIAGTGVAGYSGDGGPATSAKLNSPQGVALDAGGNIYIADGGNNLVRRIDASTGNISTFAGSQGCAYSGDGGAATSAQLCFPGGLAFDAAGDLYIADTYSMVIRRVDATTGIITTVAGNGTQGYSGDGGQATGPQAELSIPNSVAVDAAGNLYIADSYNMVIRKVTASSGEITTVAGNHTLGYSGNGGPATAASLNYPFGVSVDSAGNIYIADSYNSVIRFVDVASGQIATVVGNGTYGFSGDGGPATAAEMAFPWGVTLDASGRLFVPDLFNSRVRLVTALQPTFTVQPSTLNFGNVSVNSTSSSMPVTVQNTSPETLNFSVTFSGAPTLQFSQTNNCAAVPPKASCPINVTFTPTGSGAQGANLNISATGGATQIVQLTGNGVKLAVSPTNLIFGNQIRGAASSPQTVTLTSGSFGAVSITSVSIGTTQYTQTNNCGSSIPANSSCTINVVFKPSTTGTLNGTLFVKTGNAGSFTVALSGAGVQPSVSPTGLTFGNQIRGTTSNSQAVTVTNNSNDVLSIASISIGSTQFSQTNNCSSSVLANSSCTINVVFKPSTTGALTGTLSVKTTNAGNYNVTLSGSGVVPSVSPTTLNFGNQTHGTTSGAQPVTITNNSNGALSITSISIGSTQFAQTNNCGSSVTANSSCAINVVFKPTLKQALTGTLSVKAGNAGNYTVALIGTGT